MAPELERHPGVADRHPADRQLVEEVGQDRVADVQHMKPRTFLKVSFSRDKYDLAGNSHNSRLDYDWPMRERGLTRNTPQVHA